MAVGGDERRELFVDQTPPFALHLRAVTPEEAAGVDLQRPAALGQLVGQVWVGQDRLRPLRVRDDRRQSGALDPLPDLEEEAGRADKRNLDEHMLALLEDVAPGILVEQRRHRGQLEAEPKLERRPFSKLREGLPDPGLALLAQRDERRDVRCRVEHARLVGECIAAQRQSLVDGPNAVIAGRDDVRMDVDEAGLHPATVATPLEGTAGERAQPCGARGAHETRAAGRARG